MRISSSIVVGLVSVSIPRTNRVPNSGIPSVPVGTPSSSSVSPSASGFEKSEFETESDLYNFVQSKLSGELTYTGISSEDTAKKYIVKSGDYKLATFTLDSDENGDYYPATLSLHLPKSVQKQYRILDSSTLYINGIKVSEKYISSTEKHVYADYLPEGVPCPSWVTYTVSGLTKEPTATVTDRNSNSPALLLQNGVYSAQIIYDEDEQEITSRILTAAKQYSACMQNDVSKSSVFPYFEKGTDIYESIRTVENSFVWEHSGYGFENEKVSEFMRYDENTVSARITLVHILKKAGRADYRDNIDITFFARNIDGVYRIFAIHNN